MSKPKARTATWKHRHLLALAGLKAEEIRLVLRRAREVADAAHGDAPPLRELAGRTVATLFFEDSTRTRISFTLAAQRLGAQVVDLAVQASSVNKGETLIDTAKNVEAMGVAAMVVRARQSGAAALIAGHVSCSVLNAGDGKHEHPTQGLLDIYTLCDVLGGRLGGAGARRLREFDMSGLTVAIVGDVASSRVARSNIAGMGALGARVVCVGSPLLAPSGLAALGCGVSHDFDAVVGEADAVMMLRVQFERHGGEQGSRSAGEQGQGKNPPPGPLPQGGGAFSWREYREMYGLTPERAAKMKAHAIVMHPGPINRGLELDASVADSDRAVILDQARNGVAVRMAAMGMCVGVR